MPQALIPALIPLLIGAGTSIAGLVNRPSAPKPPPATPPTPAGPTTDQARAAITPQALSIEALTGGSVSPDYLATIAPLAAGVGGTPNAPGAIQQVLQDIFGTGGGTRPGGGGTPATPAPTPSTPAPFTPTGLPVNLAALAQTPGLSDFLQKVATAVT